MYIHIQYRYHPCATQSEGEYRGKGRVVYPSRGCRIQHYWHTTNRPALPARYFAASRALLCPVPYIYIGVHPFAKLNLSTASISAQLSTLLYVDTPTEGSPYIQYFEYIRYAGVNTATPPQPVSYKSMGPMHIPTRQNMSLSIRRYILMEWVFTKIVKAV